MLEFNERKDKGVLVKRRGRIIGRIVYRDGQYLTSGKPIGNTLKQAKENYAIIAGEKPVKQKAKTQPTTKFSNLESGEKRMYATKKGLELAYKLAPELGQDTNIVNALSRMARLAKKLSKSDAENQSQLKRNITLQAAKLPLVDDQTIGVDFTGETVTLHVPGRADIRIS